MNYILNFDQHILQNKQQFHKKETFKIKS